MKNPVHVTLAQLNKYFPAGTHARWVTPMGYVREVLRFPEPGNQSILTTYGEFYVDGSDLFQVSADDAARYLPKAP